MDSFHCFQDHLLFTLDDVLREGVDFICTSVSQCVALLSRSCYNLFQSSELTGGSGLFPVDVNPSLQYVVAGVNFLLQWGASSVNSIVVAGVLLVVSSPCSRVVLPMSRGCLGVH